MNPEHAANRFAEDGLLILDGFLDADECERLLQAVNDQIDTDDGSMVVDDLSCNRRTFLGLCPQHVTGRFKYNDLYLENSTVRETVLRPDLVAILARLLQQAPVLCNSLYFLRGSAQAHHVDSLYMTPHTPDALVAIWLALEDVGSDNGPLSYFTGSHRFQPFRFSDGSQHAIDSEMGQWQAHIDAEIRRTGARQQQFLARRGDLFIWHANLLHGGSPINDPSQTRRSLVCHYYTRQDCQQIGWADALQPLNGGYWLQRSPPAVPLSGTDWIESVPFPETRYLERNPDVAAAVEEGKVASGLAHYLRFGHRENRYA